MKEIFIEERNARYITNSDEATCFEDIKQPERSLIIDVILRGVTEFYRNPENRKKFEEWYFEKYGKSYVWKK